LRRIFRGSYITAWNLLTTYSRQYIKLIVVEAEGNWAEAIKYVIIEAIKEVSVINPAFIIC
jgi:hypothetical protein